MEKEDKEDKEEEKIHYMCESIGHRPLRGFEPPDWGSGIENGTESWGGGSRKIGEGKYHPFV